MWCAESPGCQNPTLEWPDVAITRQTGGWLLVAVQFALFVLLVVLPWRVAPADLSTSNPLIWLGVALIVAGLVVALAGLTRLGSALSANPVPLPAAGLRTSGVYAVVRHPIYSGILLSAIGFTVAVGSWWQVVVTVGLGVLFTGKSRWEDAMLAEEYGTAWQEWAHDTGAIVPRLWPRRPAGRQRREPHDNGR